MESTELRQTRLAYDDWANTYDVDPNRTRDLDAVALRRAPLALDGATIVELGAGTGKNTLYLGERAARVTALDLSSKMLERARARVTATSVEFIETDITRAWPVRTGDSDFVIGNLVLEHVRDLRPVFREARRALKAGGTFYVSELHPFKQVLGSGARFASSGNVKVRVEAYAHSVSEYISVALDSGFSLRSIAEFNHESDEDQALKIPRLLQLTLRAD